MKSECFLESAEGLTSVRHDDQPAVHENCYFSTRRLTSLISEISRIDARTDFGKRFPNTDGFSILASIALLPRKKNAQATK